MNEENSAPAPEERTVEENPVSEDVPGESEEIQSDIPAPVPSHRIESSLMQSVAEYYAKGDWIPDMSTALPDGWGDEVLGEGLFDLFGMETWSEDDRRKFSETLIGGWKDRLNKG